MSLFGALNSSVTGVRSQSDALGIISDNISNVNTTGFKANEANFSALVTGSGTPTSFNPGGVQIRPTLEAGQQGVLDSSDIATDLAVDGNGFFTVKDAVGNVDNNELLFTRNGNFRVNDEGELENANGFLLQGWRLREDANGDLAPPGDQQNPGSLETVNVTGFSGIARATQNLAINANVPSTLALDETRETTVRVFDSEGTAHNIRLEFTRDRGDGTALPGNQLRVDINAPTLADDPNAPQSGLFTPPGGSVDTQNTAAQSATQFINQQIDAAAAAPPNDPLEFTTSAGTFQVQDTTGTGIVAPDAATAQANVQTARNGPGLQIVGNGQTIEVDDANLNDLILATGDITNANGSFTGNSAEFNLLGSGPRIRISREEGGGPLDGGDNIFQQAELDTADIIQVDQNEDNDFDAGQDLTLSKEDITATGDGTEFQQVSRLSTVVEFKDGGIRQIGEMGINGDLAANSFSDAAAITSDSNGELQLGVMFGQDGAAPGGTDADQPQNLNLNLGTPLDPDGDGVEQNDRLTDGLTNFDTDFQINGIEQDGLQFGNFTGVTVGEDGIVTATFSNGERRDIFQLPVATFNNPNGLNAQSGTVFQRSPDSGEVLLNEAGVGGAGSVAPAALEQSTVELATEFTKMIETQRAFTSSTRVITTSDEMLQSIINVTR